ncbi:hypothetical protein VDGL01_11864 [Verticillium dahliae]
MSASDQGGQILNFQHVERRMSKVDKCRIRLEAVPTFSLQPSQGLETTDRSRHGTNGRMLANHRCSLPFHVMFWRVDLCLARLATPPPPPTPKQATNTGYPRPCDFS